MPIYCKSMTLHLLVYACSLDLPAHLRKTTMGFGRLQASDSTLTRVLMFLSAGSAWQLIAACQKPIMLLP